MFREKTVPYEDYDCATATYVEQPPNYIDVYNVEYDRDGARFPRGDPPNLGVAQCSNFRSGLCQVKFFPISPWSDYSILETDYTTRSVVYACDSFLGNAIKLDWLWVVTRDALAIGSPEHTQMKDEVFATINSKLEDFGDPETRLRPTQQTAGEGCVYSNSGL